MALIINQALILIFSILITLILIFIARKTNLRWWPALILRLLIIIGMIIIIFSPKVELAKSEIPSQEILVIDNSWSIDPVELVNVNELANDWKNEAKGRSVIYSSSMKNHYSISTNERPYQDQASTDLLKALIDAEKFLNSESGRIILASDGHVGGNEEINTWIAALKERGHEIQVLKINSREMNKDRILEGLITPKHQWENTPFEIQIPVINANENDLESLIIQINGELININARIISNNLIGVRIPAQKQGLLKISVFLNLPDDPNLENNYSFGNVQIYPAPTILLVSKNLDQAKEFIEKLPSQNNNITIIPPDNFPLEMDSLQDFKVIMIHNLMASDISYEVMKALKIFVTDLGGGLVFLGGNNSYTLGDYKNTIIEPLLPVKLEPPPRNKRSPITYILILDRSGSMVEIPDYSTRITLLDLAREAAMRSLETIGSEDYLGVITYESDVVWDVPVEKVGEGIQLRRAMDIIANIRQAGKTSMFLALKTGVESLNNLPSDAPNAKNILLLTDGQSSDGSDQQFLELAQQAKDDGIRISTIGLGRKVDEYVLCSLAEISGGRCHMVVTEMDLPKVMVAESEAIRSENIQFGETTLIPVEGNHPVLSGLKLNELPLLSAYNALTSKADQGAEDILYSANFGDPILSIWQYGLGRVATWMSDINEPWVQAWPNSEEENLFWSQVVRYTLVNPSIGPIQVDVKSTREGLEIFTRIEDAGGSPVNMAQVNFKFVDDKSITQSISIPQVTPGDYKLTLQGFIPGNYESEIFIQEKNRESSAIKVPFSVNYFNDDYPLEDAFGENNLSSWINSGANEIFSLVDLNNSSQSLQKNNVESESNSMWIILLLGLVVFWPIEIALRRHWLPWIN